MMEPDNETNNRLDFLRKLYLKIQNGTATEREKCKFDIEVARSSMANELLLELIKEGIE